MSAGLKTAGILGGGAILASVVASEPSNTKPVTSSCHPTIQAVSSKTLAIMIVLAVLVTVLTTLDQCEYMILTRLTWIETTMAGVVSKELHFLLNFLNTLLNPI